MTTKASQFVLLGALLLIGCSSQQYLPGYVPDHPHQVYRIDHDKMLAGDIRHNMTLVEGDVIWISRQPMFETSSPQQVTTGPRPGNLWGSHPYTIKPNDVLEVGIYELREPGVDDFQMRHVDTHGIMRLAVVGPVQAAGRTTDELSASIEEKLEASGRLRDAHVTIRVLVGQRVYAIRGTKLAYDANGPNTMTFPIYKEELTLRGALSGKGAVMDASSFIYLVRRPRPCSN